MKGEIIYKILDLLEDKAMETSDLLRATINAGYGASFGKLEKESKKLQKSRYVYQIERDNKRRLQKYISKLKNDGLIDENSTGKISLSKKGKSKIANFNKNNYSYKFLGKKEIGSKVIIISYDIPVLFNKERDILRNSLKIIGFDMVHKSVWVGKIKLPENFIQKLHNLKILDYVEIIEVTNEGTLKYKK